jgi:hypothetical protein
VRRMARRSAPRWHGRADSSWCARTSALFAAGKLLGILAGQVGDGNLLALLPKDRIGYASDIANMDAAAHRPAVLGHCLQRPRLAFARQRKDDVGVEQHGRRLVRAFCLALGFNVARRMKTRISCPARYGPAREYAQPYRSLRILSICPRLLERSPSDEPGATRGSRLSRIIAYGFALEDRMH